MSSMESIGEASGIVLPREASKYIVLQRLETQRVGQSIHYTKIGQIAYGIYKYAPGAKACFQFYSTKIEPFFRRNAIAESYHAVMRNEFETLKPHLLDSAKLILGIGPGVAGLEVFLFNHYAESSGAPNIVLIDKSRIDAIEYGFRPEAAAYNSLDLARQVLELNGCPRDKIELIEAEFASARLPSLEGRVDLITSLIAWGFHFPVSAYLDFAARALSPNGRLIIDVRRDTDGVESLSRRFRDVRVIHFDPKFDRVLAQDAI